MDPAYDVFLSPVAIKFRYTGILLDTTGRKTFISLKLRFCMRQRHMQVPLYFISIPILRDQKLFHMLPI